MLISCFLSKIEFIYVLLFHAIFCFLLVLYDREPRIYFYDINFCIPFLTFLFSLYFVIDFIIQINFIVFCT